MSNFNFWAAIILTCILGLIGYFLGSIFILPSPFTSGQTQALYTLIGISVGFATFARFSNWLIGTFTRLTKQLVSSIAGEVISQLSQLASRGLPSFPLWDRRVHDPQLVENLGGAVILDTSSIIDGRVLDVAKSGFLAGLVLLPNFVLQELQQVADSADDLKRARGRKGFEIVERLKKIDGLKVNLWEREVAGKTVDDKLVHLGKIIKGRILTCDYNLNQVAKISGVKVLNLNELANALKALPVPGERLKVKILHPGKDKEQGVGYLLDGTMVVVKNGSVLIGQESEIEVSKIIQGPAGRMVFGKTL